jgi:hypothetical protein
MHCPFSSLVERAHGKGKAVGSIPTSGSPVQSQAQSTKRCEDLYSMQRITSSQRIQQESIEEGRPCDYVS